MKLSDFFINRKLPRYWRRSWPLVCDQEKVLWVVGMAIGEAARVTASTADVLRLQAEFHERIPEMNPQLPQGKRL